MKKLITAADVKRYAEQQEATIRVGAKSIITPAARDAANEYNIQFVVCGEQEQAKGSTQYSREQIQQVVKSIDITNLSPNINPDFIEKIVAEVMATVGKCQKPPEMVKKADPCGLRLVSGNSVYLESFNTGKPQDKVRIRELFNLKESPNMSTGFMEIENTTFECDTKGDEICYIIQGTLECTVNGNSYIGQAGDVLYLPANVKIRYSARDKAKYFYVTYPAGSKK
ncbi:MAG: cupin domain-containing protein [Bacillota bacterium]